MRDAVLHHLAALVGFDTRNPPRVIAAEGGIFGHIASQLPGFTLTLTDHGAGAVSLLAVRGTPTLLFNVHLDTVPDSPAWSADPHALRVEGDRAIGLGACDIKGAAAALIAAAQVTSGDAAFLFSSDEEANDARCIPAFLKSSHGFTQVLVAEPTRCEAVLAHRGIVSAQMRFQGQAGHASGAVAQGASAVHQLMRWGTDALAFAAGRAGTRFGTMQGLRFNIGRVEGGIKPNVIAPEATLRFGFRPLPSDDIDALHASLCDFAPAGTAYEETFRGPSLPARDADAQHAAALALANACGLPVGPAVDFWTEASLFSQAGLTALVFGPGDIAQAHTADEWVALDQLDRYAAHVHRILSGGRP